eukprot:119945-Hanusia_phi.AAC.1
MSCPFLLGLDRQVFPLRYLPLAPAPHPHLPPARNCSCWLSLARDDRGGGGEEEGGDGERCKSGVESRGGVGGGSSRQKKARSRGGGSGKKTGDEEI